MAGRKEKNTVDYFPHYCNHGKTLYILENKFGKDGYNVWFKTLEELGKNENHYIDCRNHETWEFMQAKMQLISTELEKMYTTCANLDAIHKELWENRIIWSSNFVDNIRDAYKRRNNLCMNFLDLCKHLLIKCKHKYDVNGNIEDKNTQSKVKEIKVNKSKEKLCEISNEISDPYLKIAYEFWKLFKDYLTESRIATTIIDKATTKWADPIRIMLEKKEANNDELRKIYFWLKDRKSKDAQFWVKNIQSTEKLREKFPKLQLAMKTPENFLEKNSKLIKPIYNEND